MEYDKDNLEFQLSQYLDGQLSYGEAEAFLARLREHPELQAEMERYTRLDSLLGDLKQDGLPPVNFDLQRQEIMGHLERRVLLQPRTGVRYIRVAFAGAMAAAAALLITAAAMFFQPSGRVSVPIADVPVVTVNAIAMAKPEAVAQVQVTVIGSSAPSGALQVEYPRLQDTDFRLSPADAGEGSEISHNPPGTILMVGGSGRDRQAPNVSELPFE